MPNQSPIIVYYTNGMKEEFYGAARLDNTVLRIFPQHGPMVAIPLSSIQKYLVAY